MDQITAYITADTAAAYFNDFFSCLYHDLTINRCITKQINNNSNLLIGYIPLFLMDEQMEDYFEIDSVITLVDAKHIGQHLEEEEPKQQIAFADVLLINKMDLITEDKKSKLEIQLIHMNPQEQRFFTTFGEVKTEDLIGKGSFQLDNVLSIDSSLLTETHHNHNHEVNSFVLQENRSLDMDKVNKWFSYLVQIKEESLCRYKGVLITNKYNISLDIGNAKTSRFIKEHIG